MRISIVVGLGFGDEGKGSFVNYLCSVTRNPLVVKFNGGHQVGHCQTKDTLITTIDGLKYLGDIVGNETNTLNSYGLFNKNLLIENTLLLFTEKNKTINKIILSNGVELKCTQNHKYYVWNSLKMICEWVKSVDLNKEIHQFIFPKKYDLYCGNETFDLSNINDETDYILNKIKIDINKINFINVAELMGLVNGDGMFTKKGIRLIFHKKQIDVLDNVTKYLNEMNINNNIEQHRSCKSCLNLNIYSTDFLNILEKLGCYLEKGVNKRTPKFVLEGTKEIMISYLRGLFDTDGSISFHGNFGRIKFCNTSKYLSREMQQILYLNGIHSKLTIYKRKKYLTIYNIEISSFDDIILFQNKIGFISKYNNDRLNQLIKLKKNKSTNKNCVGELIKIPTLFKKKFLKDINRRGRISNTIRSEFILSNKDKLNSEYFNLINLIEKYRFVDINEILIQFGIEDVYDVTMPNTHSYISNGTISHNTVVINNKRHVFSNFGSGTLRGASTYWSEFCTVSPTGILKEGNALRKIGFEPKVYYNANAMVTTPFDIIQNRKLDYHNNHGSVGVGFGQTIQRNEDHYHLYVRDLLYPKIRDEKLRLIINSYYGFNFKTNSNVQNKATKKTYDNFIVACDDLVKRYKIVDDLTGLLNHNFIFEGGQGIMLDKNYGFFPHVTRSNTTSENAIKIIEKYNLPLTDITTYYITRAYQTRHGNGYMTNVGLDTSYIKENPNETNISNYQGEFRKTVLDIDLLKYTIACDKYHNPDYYSRKKMVITCLDQVPDQIPVTINGDLGTLKYSGIANHCGIAEKYPCYSDKGYNKNTL